MNPKVSIGIPTYEQPDFFRRSLKSVTTQTFQDYEVVITDDSRSSAITEVVSEFLPNPKIIYQKNQEQKGSPENWNEALRLARGDYVKFLHHDDWFTGGESLSVFVRLLEDNPNADFAFGASNVCNPRGEVQWVHQPSIEETKRLQKSPLLLLQGNWIGAPSATIYRKNVNRTFDPNLKWVVDIDFYLSILTGNPTLAFTATPLVNTTHNARHQVTAESQTQKVELFEWLYLYDKHRGSGSWLNYAEYKFLSKLLKKYGVRSLDDFNGIDLSEWSRKQVSRILKLQKAHLLA